MRRRILCKGKKRTPAADVSWGVYRREIRPRPFMSAQMSVAAFKVTVMGKLSERDKEMLTFENLWWKYQGFKDSAIRERFDLSPVHYYLRLNMLIETEEALAFNPMVVNRLRRLKATRLRQRKSA